MPTKTTASPFACVSLALALVTLLLYYSVPSAEAQVSTPLQNAAEVSHLCRPGEVFLRAGVPTPGCYRLVHLQEACHHSRQCIETDSFCGLDHLTNLTEQTVCVCRDDTRQVANDKGGFRCEVRHHCNIGHFNRDHQQADCPQPSMFCDRHRCLCRPGYTYDRVADECLPEQVEEATEERKKEEEMTITSTLNYSQLLDDWEKSEQSSTFNQSSTSNASHPPPSGELQIPASVAMVLVVSLFIGTLLFNFAFYKLLQWIYQPGGASYSQVESSVV